MNETNEAKESEGCILCRIWQGLGHHARHTTPVNVDEVHHAFVVGVWTGTEARGGSHQFEVCNEHKAHLTKISDDAIAAIEAAEKRRRAEPTPQQVAAMGGYKQRIAQLQRFPCPDCGTPVANGEVHSCPVPVPAPPETATQ